MFKKTLMAGAMAAAFASPGALFAADAEPASPHSFTANVGLFSQYIFRGLNQTNEDPAIQGGFDYAYNFGPASVYIGTWASNINWLVDGGQYSSSSLENDWYVGVKGPFGATDFSWDVGFLYYWYPGNVIPGIGEKGDTKEVYAALGWKWFTLKYSHSVSDETFAVRDSSGTYYIDLSASVPIGDSGVTLVGHYGKQKYKGTDLRTAALGSNDDIYGYSDWKIGVTYDLGKASSVLKGTTIGGYWTDTSGANVLGYGDRSQGGVYPTNISDGTFTFYLQKTF